MTKRVRRDYTEEFKQDAVRLVEEQGYGLTEAARSLGINRSNLERWRRERRGQKLDQGSATEKDKELARLREEVRKLRMEKDILKKAAAFFAKESN